MIFFDMLSQLQDGKYIKRLSSQRLVFLIPKVNDVWSIDLSLASPAPEYYIPTIQDLLASDWEVVE